MSSKEYFEGKQMEGNTILHSHLITILELDSIEVRGETTTKGDALGIKKESIEPISIKYGSQKNTQVHLPTLKSFARVMDIPENITLLLEQWLGVTNQSQFEGWLNGKPPTKSQQKYKRLFADDISEWNLVLDWFNNNNKKISQLLIEAMNGESPAKYLVWVNKIKNTFQVVDISKLITWIETDCTWVTGPRNRGSTLRCENKNGKPIFHLQMKGSGGTNGEYNHCPQFHIYTNWPDFAVIHDGKL